MLSREQIVDAASDALRRDGLPGLSMRRLAQELGVQPGALYHHVASKQDLLAAVADRIVTDSTRMISTTDAAQAARDVRHALLPIRDSAELISFVRALRPDALAPFQELRSLFAEQFPDQRSGWAADTLIRYVLGFVAEEQNRAELVRARIIGEDQRGEADDMFGFGVDAILRGLHLQPPR